MVFTEGVPQDVELGQRIYQVSRSTRVFNIIEILTLVGGQRGKKQRWVGNEYRRASEDTAPRRMVGAGVYWSFKILRSCQPAPVSLEGSPEITKKQPSGSTRTRVARDGPHC